ncbi:hypothetical protein BGY98DRAFT_582177 [Russula aff. rugulosa BPL654]|nr:hypothetical protein BGY98DRAFT_582177 [Russula aff. rugulosa BPL654]
MMAFPSRKETYDSNTPSDLSSRMSTNGALYRTSPKGTTIQSYRESISNSSVHTTSTAATYEDLFDYTEQDPGGIPSISHCKSFHSLEKPTFRFKNQSQSTSEAGSVRSSIATSISTPEIRSLNIPSFGDEDDFPDDLLLKASAPVFPETDDAHWHAQEGRALESKVALMASRKSSVEEVTALQRQFDCWLAKITAAEWGTVTPMGTALSLSSLLLKAILANHIACSDALKDAENAEVTLKLKVDELQLEKGRLEVELHRKSNTTKRSKSARVSA